MHPEADELYALPLTDFIAARDALAKRLRADGDRDNAAAVKKLRKPAVAAWAANQLARRHKREVTRLLDATAALRDAQRVAVHEGDPLPLREATRAHRSALDALERAAKDVLTAADMNATGTILERVRDTVQAAAVDDAEAFAAGRLVEEGRPSGFGLDGLGDVSPPARKPTPDRPASEADAPTDDGEAAAAEARQRLTEARRESREAAKAAEAAERDAERLRARAVEAERLAREARAKADEADREADRLRKIADDAAAELDRLR